MTGDFVNEIEAMYRAGVRTFVEIGPRSVLTKLVGAILKNRPFHAFSLDASNGRRSGLIDLAMAVSRLAALGYPIRLEKWESPEPAEETLRMRVPLIGANFRNPRPELQGMPQPTFTNTGSGQPSTQPTVPILPTATAAPALPQRLLSTHEETMAQNDNGNITRVVDALQSVQKGLKTIQSIQLQTAQAHQKFLKLKAKPRAFCSNSCGTPAA